MADNFTAKNASGTELTFRSEESGGIHVPAKVLVDASGNELVGEKAMTASVPVVLPNNMPLSGRGIVNPTDNFTRPADTTAYASGDLVANSTTAGSVVSLNFASSARYTQGAGKVTRCRLEKSTTSLTNASFRVHIYTAAPTGIANGDNGAWSTNRAGYIGAIDITMDRAFVDGAYGEDNPMGNEYIFFKLSSGQALRGLIEARAAYTPGSAEVFTAWLEIEQT